MKYAFKAARRPYQDPAGPEPYNVAVSSASVVRGSAVTLTAKTSDARFDSNGFGTEPSQNVVAARHTVDVPSWLDGVTRPMSAADGAFNSDAEDVTAGVDTTALAVGRHTLYVEAQDANGQWGVPSAVFLTITSPCASPVAPAPVTVEAAGSDLLLTWSHLAANDGYEVWSSETAYAQPGGATSQKAGDAPLAGSSTLSFKAQGALGDAAQNRFYAVRGVNTCGGTSPVTSWTGEFEYELTR